MPFPITVGGVEITDGPALIGAIIEDAQNGGELVLGRRTDEWLLALLDGGDLTLTELRGLTAALIQRGTPETVSVGIRLALHQEGSEFGPLLLHALGGLDIGTLLSLDPLDPKVSVEDTVLRATTKLADLTDAAHRDAMLTRLRHAGHPDLELDVLARCGNANEIRVWLPAVLLDLPSPLARPLQQASERGDDIVAAVEEVLHSLPDARRAEIMSQMGH